MRQASYELHESDEDVEWYLFNERSANPWIIDQLKVDFINTNKDDDWDWVEANAATKFLPIDNNPDSKQLRQDFIEIVMNYLFPNESWA